MLKDILGGGGEILKREGRPEDYFSDFFYGEVFFTRVYRKNRGHRCEIGTRRSFWLVLLEAGIKFLSEDNVRHYRLQNRYHLKSLHVQKGQGHDIVTSSHPSEVYLVV